MTVDSALGVSIPSHHAGHFAGEQNSLHALVVKQESSEKGFPYLLGTQLLGRAVGVENFHIVCERGPEILKTAIEDVFKHVTVVLIQSIQAFSLVSLIAMSASDTRARARVPRVRTQRNWMPRTRKRL
jgi:hypothetical protein